MKKNFFFIVFTLSSFCAIAQNDSAIFLHHSTGGGVWGEGNVSGWIDNFNSTNSTTYFADEFSYPDSPWPWENYPYDYWKLWIDGDCNNDSVRIRCIDWYASRYELIIFKHCFPGAYVGEDNGNPDVSSSEKTLGNYKAQYRALRAMMDNMPASKFMIWTLAPLHRNATDAETATRAHEFVEWVKNDFLTEDSKSHPNIFIFDFYSLVAELSASPAHGQQYCLKYDYEGDHDGNDSHPNQAANEYVGPLFGQAIVNALGNNIPITSTKPGLSEKKNSILSVSPNPSQGNLHISITKEDGFPYTIDIISYDGRIVSKIAAVSSETEVTLPDLSKGIYMVRMQTNEQTFTQPLILQ